jgi:hypothetical protein
VLTDTALKNLRPKARAYKITDRDGMYVYVSTGGAISFRYDYRFNGRRETLTLGRYGRAGLTLAQARERLIEVKKAIADGVSPAVEKQRAKRRLKEAQDFAQVAQGWMDRAPMADSTRDMRRAIFNRDVLPKWKNRLLSEITPDDLRAHCKTIVDRGAPATAIHVRDIVKQIYGWAILDHLGERRRVVNNLLGAGRNGRHRGQGDGDRKNGASHVSLLWEWKGPRQSA